MIEVKKGDILVLKHQRHGFKIPHEYPYYSRAELIQAIWPEGIEALRQAEAQIIYMHGKFKETGSGNKVLMQIGNVLSDVEGK